MVVQAELLCVALSRGAVPPPVRTYAVLFRILSRQLLQFLLRFPFFPSGRSLAENEKVGSINVTQIPPVTSTIVDSERRRLIPVFEYIIVTEFHYDDRCHLNRAALTLYRVPHFPAVIEVSCDVADATLHSAGRWGGANMHDLGPSSVREAKSIAILLKFFLRKSILHIQRTLGLALIQYVNIEGRVSNDFPC